MDFSLTTLFVAPVSQTALPSAGSTQDLTAGQIGVFLNTHALATAANIAAAPYFYIAQGRENTYLLGSKKSDRIKGCNTGACKTNVIEWYKVTGCATPVNQITEISGFHIKCGETLTVTLRAHSNYINMLYFNGLTRSVTVQAPCCDCDSNPCTDVDVPALIDKVIAKFTEKQPGTNPDNISISQFFTFERIGDDATAVLRIEGKPLNKYAQPCDIAANPYEYDRMWFNAFAYEGPDTTADFIVSDACKTVATVTTIQTSSYASGLAEEIAQMEKNYYSYQAGYLKTLFRNMGYNQNFESYVAPGEVYDTYYIKFADLDANKQTWGAYVPMDSTVIIACVSGSDFGVALEAVLEAALGTVTADNACITTTTTTTAQPTTTTTTTTVG